eukprot:TRINITY_DN8671_c0_g1_i2.p1 TRINITY_DN8671_c0_g1~~TRINITY_DN8671_c0_g1_i2.p1  ORF type:complete len:429 (-),score=42.57 TRINITY_DN8671_c0_g1_i2:189-1475(-)
MENVCELNLEQSCDQESFSRKVLHRLVESGAISAEELQAAESTVRFNDTMLLHPLGSDSLNFWDQLASDFVLSKLKRFFHVWECRRACLGCTCWQGRRAFPESQEVLIALVSPVHEDGNEYDKPFQDRSPTHCFELMWNDPHVGTEFRTIRHVSPKDATHVISDSRGLICFSTITFGMADICSSANHNRCTERPERLMHFPGRFGGAACCVAGKTLVCGGCENTGRPSARTELVDDRIHEKDAFARQIAGGSLQTARFHHACITLSGDIYAVGGFSGHGTALSSFEVYNLATKEWSVIPDQLNQPRGLFGCAVIGQTIFVFGGLGHNDEPLTSYECWTKGSGRGWIMLGNCPIGGVSSAAGRRFPNNQPSRNTVVYVSFIEQAQLWMYYPHDAYWTHFDNPCGDNRKIYSLCFAPDVGSFGCCSLPHP